MIEGGDVLCPRRRDGEHLLAAWRGLAGFEGRSSVRVWLFQIATRRCLNALRSASRRPPMDWPPPGVELPQPTRLGDVTWLEPYPDVLLAELADDAPGPEARYEAREALQYRQARSADREPPPGSERERALVQRFTAAYEAGDVQALVALLTEDAWLIMPPVPLRYQGRELAARFWAATAFRPGRSARLVPTRANGQPAFGLYIRDPRAPVAHASGILVLTLAGSQISAVTGFLGNSALPIFGPPRTLPD